MNSVGIDVPKKKEHDCRYASLWRRGVSPIENQHTDGELSLLRGLPRETCVVTESTGNYHLPVAWLLNASGFYVSVVSAALAHDYGNNLRRAKTDKKEAIKLANDGLDHWLTLPRYIPEKDT